MYYPKSKMSTDMSINTYYTHTYINRDYFTYQLWPLLHIWQMKWRQKDLSRNATTINNTDFRLIHCIIVNYSRHWGKICLICCVRRIYNRLTRQIIISFVCVCVEHIQPLKWNPISNLAYWTVPLIFIIWFLSFAFFANFSRIWSWPFMGYICVLYCIYKVIFTPFSHRATKALAAYNTKLWVWFMISSQS